MKNINNIVGVLLIILNLLWFGALCIKHFPTIKKTEEFSSEDLIDYCPNEREYFSFGDYLVDPKLFEDDKFLKTSRYYYYAKYLNSEDSIRKKLDEYFSSEKYIYPSYTDRLLEYYYRPGIKYEKSGQLILAYDRFRMGFNHCFHFASKYGLGDVSFQRLYSGFRLRCSFYKKYMPIVTTSSINSAFTNETGVVPI